MKERIKNWITPRGLAVFLTIVYLLSLVPLLLIGWYNYPSADDYTIGNDCRQAWVSTHNLLKVLWAGIVRAAADWKEWMGYFTSNFLMAVPPSSFGERFYVLTVWIMLAMLSLSTIYLFKNIFVKVFRADPYVSHCVSMAVLLVTVQCMVGRVEAFYWYCGAVNYMFVHGMSLFFREKADYVIDTSRLLTRELKEELDRIFVQNEGYNSLMVTILSFGFKYGIPADADLVFDVRFLPNPFYIDELKHKTGNDKEVQDYVMSFPEAHVFIEKLADLAEFLIPNYVKEGKYQLVIGIGCTGGKHRSVTLANKLYTHMKDKGEYGIKIAHRDVGQGV